MLFRPGLRISGAAKKVLSVAAIDGAAVVGILSSLIDATVIVSYWNVLKDVVLPYSVDGSGGERNRFSVDLDDAPEWPLIWEGFGAGGGFDDGSGTGGEDLFSSGSDPHRDGDKGGIGKSAIAAGSGDSENGVLGKI